MMIRLTNISKSFFKGENNEVRALQQVTQVIEQGEMVALTGPSGSGKSTLLHILGLLDVPDTGAYEFEGQRTDELKDAARAKIRNTIIGIVLQDYGIIPELSVKKNVELPLLIRGLSRKEIKEKTLNIIEKVGLTDKISVRAGLLSGGQKQRVAIARALVGGAKLLLADEPTGALDSATTREIMDLLCEVNKAGCTIIVATHDPLVAERCGREIRLMDGRIVDSLY